MSTTHWYKFKADMPCIGCSNAIQKCLNKRFQQELAGADTSLEEQTVKVTIRRDAGQTPYTYEEVYEAVAKSGKTITKLNASFGSI